MRLLLPAESGSGYLRHLLALSILSSALFHTPTQCRNQLQHESQFRHSLAAGAAAAKALAGCANTDRWLIEASGYDFLGAQLQVGHHNRMILDRDLFAGELKSTIPRNRTAAIDFIRSRRVRLALLRDEHLIEMLSNFGRVTRVSGEWNLVEFESL